MKNKTFVYEKSAPKRGIVKKIFIALILLLLLSVLIYFLLILFIELKNTPIKKNIDTLKNAEKPSELEPSYSTELQFYPNMRFPKKLIFYKIDSICSQDKKIRVRKAFEVLENKTSVLKFNEVESNQDIYISCDETMQQIEEKYFIAGEGGATSVINATLFYIIEQGRVLLFYEENRCNNENIELHEILHVFGFKHSENPNSIMYNVSSCNQILTNDIVNELIRLYSIEELPELSFSDFSVEKHSVYLDFVIEIRNKGLKASENTVLSLYSENKKIKDFNIGEIDYGEGRKLEVKNVWIGLTTKKIKFIVETEKDMDIRNNVLDIEF